jgi:hypothetical protein
MKTLIILFTLEIGLLLGAQIENDYLKINVNRTTEINYPANSSFELIDRNGYALMTSEILKDEYELTEKATLLVNVSWKNTPETIELKKGSKIQYVTKKQSKRNDRLYRMPIDGDAVKDYSNGVSVIKKTFIERDGDRTNDAIIEFSNGITFTYKNGEAAFTKNDQELTYENKYIVQLKEGVFKLSYNPYTTETWFVFEPKK